jgi:replicative superfamily II helicase
LIEEPDSVKVVGYLDLATLLATGGGDAKFYEIATRLEKSIRRGFVSERLADVSRLYSVLSYAICGEYAYKKMIENIQRSGKRFLAFDELLSPSMKSEFSQMIIKYVNEDFRHARTHCGNIITYLNAFAKDKDRYSGYFKFHSKDEADSLIDVLSASKHACDWFLAQNVGAESSGSLQEYFGRIHTNLAEAALSPWFSFLSLLYIELIQRDVDSRSIRTIFERHEIDHSRVQGLADHGLARLWPSQAESCEMFLQGENLLLSTQTGTGKTTLGLVALAASRGGEGRCIFAASTRALAHQVFNRITNTVYPDKLDAVKVFSKEDSVDEESLKNVETIVGTYEKIDGIFRENLLSEHDVKVLVVDECHTIADPNRGVTLDFLLTKFAKTNPTQKLLLSATIPDDDLGNFANWANAHSPRLPEWRRTDLDEFVQFRGRRYPIENLPHIEGPSESERREAASDAVMMEALRSLKDGKMALIVVAQRQEAEKYAARLKDVIRNRMRSALAQEIDADLRSVIRDKQDRLFPEFQKLDELELVLPKAIEHIRELATYSVTFHHAGMPKEVRSMVESWIERKMVGIVVATSTLEMGVDFPVDIVLIKNLVQARALGRIGKKIRKLPKDPLGQYVYNRYLGVMKAAYRNTIGRAGRASYSDRGESIYFATGLEDLDLLREMWTFPMRELPAGADLYFLSRLRQTPLLQSDRDVEESRGRFMSALVGAVGRTPGVTTDQVLERIQSTWFWRKLSGSEMFGVDRVSRATRLIEEELEFLRLRGFLIRREQMWLLCYPLGYVANDSLISPISLGRVIGFLNSINLNDLRRESIELLLLYAVCLVYELQNIAPQYRKSPMCSAYASKIEAAARAQIDERAAFKSAILDLWVNGMLVEDICRKLDLNESVYSFISYELPENAIWILRCVPILFPALKEVASGLIEYLRVGSKSPFAIALKDTHPGLKRTSICAIEAKFSVKEPKDFLSISEKEFVKVFERKKGLAEDIYKAVRDRLATRLT